MFSEAFVDADGGVVQGLPDMGNFVVYDDHRLAVPYSSLPSTTASRMEGEHHLQTEAILESKTVLSTSSVISFLPYEQASPYSHHQHQVDSLEQQADLENFARENLRLRTFIRERYGNDLVSERPFPYSYPHFA